MSRQGVREVPGRYEIEGEEEEIEAGESNRSKAPPPAQPAASHLGWPLGRGHILPSTSTQDDSSRRIAEARYCRGGARTG